MSLRPLVISAAVLALCGCPLDQAKPPNTMTSFKVTVLGVYENINGVRTPLPVVAPCVAIYGSQDMVPFDVKGQPGCRYVIPRGEAEFEVKANAVGIDGQPFVDFNGSVSFRVVPGELPPNMRARWAAANAGEVSAFVRAIHPYGEARVWVEDAPPRIIYDAGLPNEDELPAEPVFPAKRTYASGASPIVYFADQTLQSVQMPGELDNRSSPFVGNFVQIGKNPASGETLKQNCPDDPARDGRESLMVVTGLDPSGFFVTDISACRVREQLNDTLGGSVRTGEPVGPCWLTAADGGLEENRDAGFGRCNISEKSCRRNADCFGYSPGTYASMFVYNYNFPDNLDEGDLLFTLSGGIQEFTSTTQLVFPSWTVAERVRRLPEDQWNKWLQYARPYDLGGRTCGQDNAANPFLTDSLCGHNRRNMKMESLESGLVRIRRVRFPQKFENCDFNANGQVPFFCETRPPGFDWMWSTCSFDAPEPEADRIERTCNHDCIIGLGANAGVICSEQATFRGFGQYVVEMAPPGPSSLGLDDQLSLRIQTVFARLYVPPPPPDAGMDAGIDAGFDAGIDAGVDAGPDDGGMDPDAGDPDAGDPDAGDPDAGMDVDAGFDAGVDAGVDAGIDAGVDAGIPQNPVVRAGGYFAGTEVVITCDKPARYRVGDANVVAGMGDALVLPGQIIRHTFTGTQSTVAFQADLEQARCTVGINAHTRINLITRDAVPELEPDCSETDPDPERAEQCRFLRGAEFDIIGHLRQAQPARPRWIVIPRYPDDLCCYPGPGMQCPRPIRQCQ